MEVSLLLDLFCFHRDSGSPVGPVGTRHFFGRTNQLHVLNTGSSNCQFANMLVGNSSGQLLILGGLEDKSNIVQVRVDSPDVGHSDTSIDKLRTIF